MSNRIDANAYPQKILHEAWLFVKPSKDRSNGLFENKSESAVMQKHVLGFPAFLPGAEFPEWGIYSGSMKRENARFMNDNEPKRSRARYVWAGIVAMCLAGASVLVW